MLPKLFSSYHRNRLTLGSRDPWGFFPYRINLSSFTAHMYVCGRSGTGKSFFLLATFTELASKGYACGLLDPHSDLANDSLAVLSDYYDPSYMDKPFLADPANRQRLLYLDPSRTDYIVPLNVLINSYATPHEIAQNVVDAWKRTWPDLGDAPRFSEILRNSVQVLAECGLSLVELIPFLTDTDFRAEVLSRSTDPLVQWFFARQFNRWGKNQLEWASPVLNKASDILFTPQVRCCLGAKQNLLDLRRIADDGRCVIIDLGGFNDKRTRVLLGSLIVTSLERAAFSRRELPADKRRPFYFWIDEFPSFMDRDENTLAYILSECRKYRIHLGLAHQTITQLSSGRLQGAMENCDLKIIFASGRQTAKAIAETVWEPDTHRIKHEVKDEGQRERTHPVFEPLVEQWENTVGLIQKLKQRQILVHTSEHAPLMRLKTPTVRKRRCSPQELEQLKRYLLKRDGIPYASLKQEVDRRLQDPHGFGQKQVVYYQYD